VFVVTVLAGALGLALTWLLNGAMMRAEANSALFSDIMGGEPSASSSLPQPTILETGLIRREMHSESARLGGSHSHRDRRRYVSALGHKT
jgi:hypothetical protein